MSFGSFEPPPVKAVCSRLDSAVQVTAVAPLVCSVVPHLVPGPFGSTTSWQTLSQSSLAFGPIGWVALEASPSSWKMPVSWTASALETKNASRATPARRRTARRRLPVKSRRDCANFFDGLDGLGEEVLKESAIWRRVAISNAVSQSAERFSARLFSYSVPLDREFGK